MPSNREIHHALCAPGQFFEIETVEIRGVPTSVWKNALPNLGALLAQGAATGGGRDFIVYGDERISHERHRQLVDGFAASLLTDLGISKGDRVAIAMRNLPEWSVAFFGATKIGAVVVPLNAFGNGDELAYLLSDCDASVVVADGERLERLASVPGALHGRTVVGTRVDDRKGTLPLPAGIIAFDSLVARDGGPGSVEVAPDDLATIFYTSGTESRPKGVAGTHRNICTILTSMMFAGARGALRDGEAPQAPAGPAVQLLTVPLFHATGCHCVLMSSAFFGGTLVFMRRWDPEAALDLMERERVTAFTGVPAMLWDVVNSPSLDRRDLSCLGRFGGGGAASPPALARAVSKRFPGRGTGTGYGLTETSSLTASIGGTDYLARPDSVGVPVPVCDVRIVDPDGRDVPPGEAGEIWIKGPNVVPGYWNQPELTAATFTQGWVRSGDIGRTDDEGFLYIVDRAKDIVIRGGENISTLEVESVLLEHPAVLEVVVFSTPHPALGEEVGAVVRTAPRAEVTAGQLRAHAAAALAAHKVPAHIWLTTEPLPRGDTGKILKRAVQAEYASLAPGS